METLRTLEAVYRSTSGGEFVEAVEKAYSDHPNGVWAKAVAVDLRAGRKTAEKFPSYSIPTSPNEADLLDELCARHLQERWNTAISESTEGCRVSGIKEDCLGSFLPPDAFGAGAVLNQIFLRGITHNSPSAAVVVTMRDDGPFIIEWVAHYLALGFDKIFIYSNDNCDQSTSLLTALANAGHIEFIESFTSGAVSPQRKAFEHSIHLSMQLRSFEWVFYADSDEYLVLPEADNITPVENLLAQLSGKKTNAVLFNWKWYLSDYVYSKTHGLTVERFQHSVAHNSFKALVHLPNVESMRMLHFPEVTFDRSFTNSCLEVLLDPNPWNFKSPDYRGGQVNHYWHKSFEEFAFKKLRANSLTGHASKEYVRAFDLFFDWNKGYTSENYTPYSNIHLAKTKKIIQKITMHDAVVAAAETVANASIERLNQLKKELDLITIYNTLAKSRSLPEHTEEP